MIFPVAHTHLLPKTATVQATVQTRGDWFPDSLMPRGDQRGLLPWLSSCQPCSSRTFSSRWSWSLQATRQPAQRFQAGPLMGWGSQTVTHIWLMYGLCMAYERICLNLKIISKSFSGPLIDFDSSVIALLVWK